MLLLVSELLTLEFYVGSQGGIALGKFNESNSNLLNIIKYNNNELLQIQYWKVLTVKNMFIELKTKLKIYKQLKRLEKQLISIFT